MEERRTSMEESDSQHMHLRKSLSTKENQFSQQSGMCREVPPSKTPGTENTDLQNEISSKCANQNAIIIQLEPSLSEKLAKKRAVAIELEDQLQKLRLTFDDKLGSVERVKEELNRREWQLLQSVEKIEEYMQKIYSLKREAEGMYKMFKGTTVERKLELLNLSKKCRNVSAKRDVAQKMLETFNPVKIHLEDIVYDFPNCTSAKDLVEYFLVLKTLRKDLLEEDKKSLKEAERLATKRQRISESTRSHPLNVLAKEDILCRLKAKVKDIHMQNMELGQQVNSAVSAKAKEDLMWYDTKLWIKKLYKSTFETMNLESKDPKDNTSDQLQIIHNFVIMGSQMIKRLKE